MAVITISREFGAGGRTLGQLVAEKLGYTLIDETLIEMVANEANVSTDWVKSIEKQGSGSIIKYISKFAGLGKGYLSRLADINKGYIDGSIYINLLQKIIPQIAQEGNVVILGRGGQYILKNYESTYHLLLVADLEDRITFMEEHYDLSRKEAGMIVKQHDKRRKSLYSYFGRDDYDQPHIYHMAFNMSLLKMEKVVNQVCLLVD
jgi:cytidylate kinase